MSNEVQTFLEVWDEEARKTGAMLRSLPDGKYDFRPDAGGRSLGELGWHLAEVDAYMTYGIQRGVFEMGAKPPGIERPKNGESHPVAQRQRSGWGAISSSP